MRCGAVILQTRLSTSYLYAQPALSRLFIRKSAHSAAGLLLLFLVGRVPSRPFLPEKICRMHECVSVRNHGRALKEYGRVRRDPTISRSLEYLHTKFDIVSGNSHHLAVFPGGKKKKLCKETLHLEKTTHCGGDLSSHVGTRPPFGAVPLRCLHSPAIAGSGRFSGGKIRMVDGCVIYIVSIFLFCLLPCTSVLVQNGCPSRGLHLYGVQVFPPEQDDVATLPAFCTVVQEYFSGPPSYSTWVITYSNK